MRVAPSAQEPLARARSLPNDSSVAKPLRAQAVALERAVHADPRAGVAAARGLLNELRELPESPDRTAAIAIAHARCALGLTLSNDLRAAFDEGLKAEALVEEIDDPDAQAMAWMALGHTLFLSGQLAEAERWLARAADHEAASPGLRAHARTNVAATLRAAGALTEATEAFDALMQFRGSVERERWASTLINAASCWHQVDRAEDALEVLQEARSLLVEGERPDLHAWVDAIESWTQAKLGDMPRAARCALAALDPKREPGVDLRSSAARALARAADELPEFAEQARQELLAAVRVAEAAGARRQAIDLRLMLVDAAERRDDLVAAVEHLRAARSLEGELTADSRRLRLEQEELRIELARMQIEADGLRARRKELRLANQALAATDAARSRLLRTLAHDLRNPLQSIFASAELLEPTDPRAVRKHLVDLMAAAERMASLLEGALRPEATAPRPRVNAVSVARSSVSAFRGLAGRKEQRIELEGADSAVLNADADALGRILDNLLSNALKFSGGGATTRVEVHATDARVDLWVRDEGPGFPELDAADGLLLGRQLATRATGGEASWGLGLHAVYLLVAEQGGVLALGNRPEGGAVVRVSLPR